MQIKRILTWPNTPTNGINPWHVILRRLFIYLPFVYIGLSLVWLGVLISFGYEEAMDTWDSVL